MILSAAEDRKGGGRTGQHPLGLSGLSAPRIGSLFSGCSTTSWKGLEGTR
jgi:hypothetical protein